MAIRDDSSPSPVLLIETPLGCVLSLTVFSPPSVGYRVAIIDSIDRRSFSTSGICTGWCKKSRLSGRTLCCQNMVPPILGAGGGTRTHTLVAEERILSPPRLPFRHPGTLLATRSVTKKRRADYSKPWIRSGKIRLELAPFREWGCSSAGRARRSQCRGQGFDPPQLHQPSGGAIPRYVRPSLGEGSRTHSAEPRSE